MHKTSENYVTLVLDESQIKAHIGDSLFDLAQAMGIPLPSSCDRQGKCRECLIEIIEGNDLLSSADPEDSLMAEGYRLACKTRITSSSGTIVCRTLRRSPIRIDEEGTSLPESSSSLISSAVVIREKDQLKLHTKFWEHTENTLHGLAIDLGTTTIVVRLVDLESGRVKASHSFENPQRYAGSDVMARIHFDEQDPSQSLKRVLIGYINRSIQSFPVHYREIVDVVVAGNPTMRDLFFGLNVSGLGQLPFRSTTEKAWRNQEQTSTAVENSASNLGLRVHPKSKVYGLPIIGCHVGADTAACILATDFLKAEEPSLIIDIGTNTELVYRFSDQILAASCPAGPAFEGGFVKCGMPALDGAIEKTHINEDQTVEFEIIGTGPPKGICGSGLVSILGELTRTDKINELGRLKDNLKRFVLDADRSIFIDEQDISNLAQAKGANSAGLRILFKQIDTDFQEIPRVYLAGAFARHLDLDAARRIGLVPSFPDGSFVRLGNASIEGATIALLSLESRRKLEEFVATIKHIELETDSQFFDAFVEGCLFKPF